MNADAPVGGLTEDEDEDEDRVRAVIHIEIPAEASEDDVERLMDAVCETAYGIERDDWDPFMHAHTDGGCEDSPHCCGPGSRYLNAREAAARAEAWDEGYDAAAWRSFRRTDISIGRADEANPPNPYRADAPAPREAERDAGVEHVVHVTAEPVAEDVVWCDECEEWVAASAPESAAENAPREGGR